MNEILNRLEKLLSLSDIERQEIIGAHIPKAEYLDKVIGLMKDLRTNLIEQSDQASPWVIVSTYIMVLGEYAALTGFPKDSTVPGKMFAAGYETGEGIMANLEKTTT